MSIPPVILLNLHPSAVIGWTCFCSWPLNIFSPLYRGIAGINGSFRPAFYPLLILSCRSPFILNLFLAYSTVRLDFTLRLPLPDSSCARVENPFRAPVIPLMYLIPWRYLIIIPHSFTGIRLRGSCRSFIIGRKPVLESGVPVSRPLLLVENPFRPVVAIH